MGRDAAQDPALLGGLDDQADVALLQVAHAAMDQLRRSAGGSRGEVSPLDDRDAQAAQGRVAGHAGSADSSAADQQRARLSRPLAFVSAPSATTRRLRS